MAKGDETVTMELLHESRWQDLATDLLLRVFSNLTASELGRAACVCQTWRCVVKPCSE